MPTINDLSEVTKARIMAWVEASRPGFCGYTTDYQRNRCSVDSSGSFGLSLAASSSIQRSVAVCLKHCDACERCNFITVNPRQRDCSWYHTCNTSNLLKDYPGYISGAVTTAGKKASAALLKGDKERVMQRVVLFMHMEKTGGTFVRTLFSPRVWNRTGFCSKAAEQLLDVKQALLDGQRQIFVEHHCFLNWNLPRLLINMVSDLNERGLRVRYRSFTLLRSPATLSYSQYNYWQHSRFLPLDLYTQLASEMLLFRDPMKLIQRDQYGNIQGRVKNLNQTGGIFLNLRLSPLPNRSVLCNTDKWKRTCALIVERFDQLGGKGSAKHRRRRLQRGNSEIRELSVHEESAEILVRHAERVQHTIWQRGCESLLAEAAERLSTLSHVFFLEASMFSMMHIKNMALDDSSVNGGVAPVNQAKGHSVMPYHEEEALQSNTCAEYVYGKLFARLASASHSFNTIAEQEWLLPPTSTWSSRREHKLVMTPGTELTLGTRHAA